MMSNHSHPYATTLVSLLKERARDSQHSETQARSMYRFCGDLDVVNLSYGDLDRQARQIANVLRSHHDVGDRILLVYPPGLDFIAGFFGCLYAGMIAVPIYPPRRNQRATRLQAIISDAQSQGILTVSHLIESLQPSVDSSVRIHACDRLPIVPEAELTDPQPEDIAFLQYTSGSTGNPKGVRISHGNLIHNLQQICEQFGHSPESHGVIWLPPYHDMGLIGGILQPLYANFPVTLLSPIQFLQKPLTWLETISQMRGTTSGGPNFAYELCIQKITSEQIQHLDLSSWNMAFIGAEPIRSETIDRFSKKFASCGFQKSDFYSCYGLAEATLFVTGGRNLRNESGRVSCGQPTSEQTIRIVSPETLKVCAEGIEGEVWIRGESIAQGYWNQDSTLEFSAILDEDKLSYLRSGDLGIWSNNELYITGRIKDVMIIRGRNVYPQDIEQTIESCHLDLQPSANAAFSVDTDGEERLMVVQEIKRSSLRSANLTEIETAIRSAISTQHQLQVTSIVLIKPGSIPKTSSGKVQRYQCKLNYSNQTLNVIPKQKHSAQPSSAETHSNPNSQTVADQRIEWLRDYAQNHINSQIIDDRRTIPPYVVLDFGNQGLLGMQVNQSYGGLGLDHQSSLRILQQLGAIDPTLALFVGLNNVLGIRPIEKFGSTALKDELLPKLATGRELAAFALTEPIAGSNPQAIRSSAIPQGSGYVLNGMKIWSGSAAWAGVTTAFVQQYDAQQQPIGMSGYVLRRGVPGLRQGPEALTMGMRGMVQNAIYLENVVVGDGDLLGTIGGGMAVAQDAMMYGRVAIAAACVGGMKRCAQLMVRYGSGRSIATGKLIDNPVLQWRLGQIVAMIAAVEALVTIVGEHLDRNWAVPAEVYAACKITAPEYYWQAADWLMQSLGGRGYIEPNLAPQILRDARVLRIFEGPTETLCGYLGLTVLRQPEKIVKFIRERLVTTTVADRFEQAVETIRDYHRQHIQNPESSQRLNYLVGDLTATILLWAASINRDNHKAIVWAEQRFGTQLEQILKADSKLEPVGMIAEIAEYIHAIGDIEQTLAGEDRELDEYLRRSPQSTAIAVSMAQTTSSIGKPKPSSDHVLNNSGYASNNQVQQWLVDWLSQKANLPVLQIDADRAFADYGIDSVMAVELAQDLEDAFELDQSLDVTVAWNFPTIKALAHHVQSICKMPLPELQHSPIAASTTPVQTPPVQTVPIHDDSIAIIGMACRFPNAADLDEYWKLLRDGNCAVGEVPADRWNVDEYYDTDPDVPGKMYTRSGCFIDSPEQFDAAFFGISPREAKVMDPQQRLLLETTYRTIEHAGIPVEKLRGTKTGVYVGLCFDDYARSTVTSGDVKTIDAFSSLGNTRSIAAGRISYVFGLQGTTMQLDTTCSSSLLAVHLASQALRSGELNMALVGGVNLILAPEVTIGFCKLKALAPDGKSKAFDADADGYGRGEGCGMVLLKRARDAERDGDRILAVVRGSAVNHDGTSNGLTAPSGTAQAAVIRQALENAKVPAAAVQYVEAHGTGTVLGDPIEVMALQQVLGEERSQPLQIGSVKANIGHLESAAGVAGIIKLVLSMQHQALPPQIHYHQPNPHIPWEDLSIQVCDTFRPWTGQKIAGISSFGMSGTNVHLILESVSLSPHSSQNSADVSPNLLLVSAKSNKSLLANIQSYLNHIKTSSHVNFTNFCQATVTDRSHFNHCASFVVTDRQDAIIQLQNYQPEAQINNSLIIEESELLSNITASNYQYSRECLQDLSQAYMQHLTIDWSRLYSTSNRQMRHEFLPEYVFEKQTYWVDRPKVTISEPHKTTHPLLGSTIKLARSKSQYFESSVSLSQLPDLNDHCVTGRCIFPTSGYLEMVWAAIESIAPHKIGQSIVIENFRIHKALLLSDSNQTKIQTIVDSIEQNPNKFEILAHQDDKGWETYSSGEISIEAQSLITPIDINRIKTEFSDELEITNLYQIYKQYGLDYGASFQSIQKAWKSPSSAAAIGWIEVPESTQMVNSDYIVHPILLDGCLQVIGVALGIDRLDNLSGYVPVSCDRISRTETKIPTGVWAIVRLQDPIDNRVNADMQITDSAGQVLIELLGMELQKLPPLSDSLLTLPKQDWESWIYDIQWKQVSIEPQPALIRKLLVIQDDSLSVEDRQSISAVFSQSILKFVDAKILKSTFSTDEFQPDQVLYWSTSSSIDYEEMIYETHNLLDCIQILMKSQVRKLAIVTAGAVSVEAGDRITSWEGSSLWGFAKTLRLEAPKLLVQCIDLDARVSFQLQSLPNVLNSLEESICIRVQKQISYYAPSIQSKTIIHTLNSYQLQTNQSGNLDQLSCVSYPRRSPTHQEVEIRVLATGVNFRDVLNALDLYPGDAGALGCECAGEIVSLGATVTQFRIGDRVIALAAGSYSQYVTIESDLVIAYPSSLTPVDAASIGVVFLTAFYALCYLAQLKKGDRVLIHAAAGGVGQAAIQVAQSIGAEVYATASPEKWELVKALGVKHIFNSRDLQFGDDILQASQSQPMDVVLNCLSGDFIDQSLSLLHPKGHFLELGKMGIWTAEEVAKIHPMVHYKPIDLVALCHSNPVLIQSLLQSVMQYISQGIWKPIAVTVFPIGQVIPAFRMMQQGIHQGKLVVTSVPSPVKIRTDRSYVIMGGTGGLGLATAELLIAEGATSIVLLSRNLPTDFAQARIQELKDLINIQVLQVDGRDPEAIDRVIQNLPLPLAGVIHAAGVLSDAPITQQTQSKMETVIATKALTAWNLHRCTENLALDFFVIFSSATALFGSPGQVNHVIANTAIDTLAQYRRQLGLPALSINWGVWSQIGSAATQSVTAQMAMRGVRSMAPQTCIAALRSLLLTPPESSSIAVMDIDWNALRQQRSWGRFLDSIDVEVQKKDAVVSDILQQLQQCDRSARVDKIEDYLKQKLSKILGFKSEEIDSEIGFFDMGMDSLTAVELSSRIKTDLSCILPTTAAFDYPTVSKLAQYLNAQLTFPDIPEMPPDRVDINSLEISDLAALLQQELLDIQEERQS